jgi:hypothetical protein
MDVHPIFVFENTRVAFEHLLRAEGISAQHIHEVIMPRIRISNNQLYLNIQFEDIDLSQIRNQQNFARMRSAAPKYLIPIPSECEPIPTKTIVVTSEGTKIVESSSVAQPGGFVVLNNPTPEAQAVMNKVHAQLAHTEPRERILAMMKAAQDYGVENIFPAGRNFENVIEDTMLPIEEPELYHVKPSMLRAIARFPGPTIIDQTSRWGAKEDGLPNYQVQPNTVFIIHLDEYENPIMENNLVKANGYELRPFIEDYRTLGGAQLTAQAVPAYVPLVPLKGDLAKLDEREIEAVGGVLLQYNRELRLGKWTLSNQGISEIFSQSC